MLYFNDQTSALQGATHHVPILRILLNFSPSQLKHAQEILANSFARETSSFTDGFCSITANTWTAKSEATQASINDALKDPQYVVGIDLPWLLHAKGANKTVMIVGQNPLRNPNHFKKEKQTTPIVIGTPYAVHSSFLEDYTSAYRKIIEGVHRLGCNAYLTDAKKIYSGRKFVQDDLDRDALDEEVRLIKPDLIVCLGNKAREGMRSNGEPRQKISESDNITRSAINDTPILSTLHPSGLTNRFWRARLQSESRTDEAKAGHIVKAIGSALLASRSGK